MLAQYVVGFTTAILYLIAVFYCVTDLDSMFESELVFPLGEIYIQVAGTTAGSIGLLFLVLAPTMFAALGCFLTATRVSHNCPFPMVSRAHTETDVLDPGP
jgi:hypothetical protein